MVEFKLYVRVTQGKVTIPKLVREAYGIRDGMKLRLEAAGGTITLTPLQEEVI